VKGANSVNLLSTDFEATLNSKVVEIVANAMERLPTNNNQQRYLNKKQAKAYIGGIDDRDFDECVSMGLKQIVIKRPSGSATIRYDARDLDEFMAKYKI
jgi:hypothetical protein